MVVVVNEYTYPGWSVADQAPPLGVMSVCFTKYEFVVKLLAHTCTVDPAGNPPATDTVTVRAAAASRVSATRL